jgi:hypothetical protein
MKNETRLFPTFILVFVAVLSRLPRSLLGKTWPTKQSLHRAYPRIEPGQRIDANDVLERQDRIDDSKPEVAADRHEVGRKFSKTAESERVRRLAINVVKVDHTLEYEQACNFKRKKKQTH